MNKQLGLSFFGFILVAMLVAAAAITAFKVVPAYNQYFSAKSTIARLAKDHAGMSQSAIREAFSKNAQIGYIEDVKPEDLKVIQAGGVTRIVVEYEKVVPLVGHVSLLFSFHIDESSGKSVGN